MKKWREGLETYVSAPPGKDDAEGWGWLADAYVSDHLNRWNECEGDPQAGDDLLTKAEQAANEAFKRDLGLAIAHYAMGMVYRAQGNHQQALTEFKAAVDATNPLPRYYAQYGNELINVGRAADAVQQVNTAIQNGGSDPSIGVFHWILGRAYLFMSAPDYANAIKSLEASVTLRNNLWYNRLYLVSAHANNGQLTNAQTALAEFKKQFPNFTPATLQGYETDIPNANLVGNLDAFHDGLRKVGFWPP